MKLVFGECSSRKVTIRVTIDAGSSVEYNGAWTAGIAHLVEHMIFQGTEDLKSGDMLKLLAFLGADWNAATWHDKVSFYLNVPIDNIYPAAELFRNMLLRSAFREEDFNKEKRVVLTEEKDHRDDIDSIIWEKFDSFIASGPLANSIIGTSESIQSITLDEAKEFYNTYYKPNRMLLSITGSPDLDCDRIAELFGPVKTRFTKTRKEPNTHTDRKWSRFKDKRIQQARIFMPYKAVPLTSRYALPLNFANKFFSEDMDSRLFQKVRNEHGLCYSIGAYLQFYSEVGWYTIITRTAPENLRKVTKLINKEIEILVNDGPTEEEMERARNKYISEIYTATETSYGLNSVIAGKAFNGLPNIETTIERVKGMTTRSVRAACAKVFRPENKQVFMCLPEEEC